LKSNGKSEAEGALRESRYDNSNTTAIEK